MKKILSNVIFSIVVAVCGFLVISNIFHIIYLNKQATYDFNNLVVTNIKEDLKKLEANVNVISNLDNTMYSEEDLKIIKDTFETVLKDLKEDELLQYEGVKHFYAKDLLALDMKTNTSTVSNIKLIEILTKYDESISSYLKLYKYDFINSAYNRDGWFQKALQAYKYTTPDFFNTTMYEPVNAEITARIFTLSYNVLKQDYIAQFVLRIGGGNNE